MSILIQNTQKVQKHWPKNTNILFSDVKNKQFNQRSPVHQILESRGGALSVTEEEKEQQDSTSPF